MTSLPELWIFMLIGYLFLIGKNVSILMVLSSINKVYYERSYDLFKLNVKNDIIFAPTLYMCVCSWTAVLHLSMFD